MKDTIDNTRETGRLQTLMNLDNIEAEIGQGKKHKKSRKTKKSRKPKK